MINQKTFVAVLLALVSTAFFSGLSYAYSFKIVERGYYANELLITMTYEVTGIFPKSSSGQYTYYGFTQDNFSSFNIDLNEHPSRRDKEKEFLDNLKIAPSFGGSLEYDSDTGIYTGGLSGASGLSTTMPLPIEVGNVLFYVDSYLFEDWNYTSQYANSNGVKLQALGFGLHAFDSWVIGDGDNMHFHRLSVTNDVELLSALPAVPEPSTWILLGTGLAGLAYYRKKKS